MLTDVAALGLALFAMWLASRATRPERTFGYLRAEILAALVNAVSLIVLAIYIFWEAWQRLQEPPEVESGPLLVVAVAGMLANIASAWVLSRGGGHRDNLNTRGAFLHVLGDLLGSVATIAAALIITFTGWYAADPILSVLIGGLVVFGAWSLLRESVDVLLEAAPRGVVVAEVRRAMDAVPGVEGVHDLHVWTVTSGLTALSAHVETENLAGWETCMTTLATMLREQFGIAHATLQPESPRSASDTWDRCSIDAPDGRAACLTATKPAARLKSMPDTGTDTMTDSDTTLLRQDDVPASPARGRSWLPVAFAAIALAMIAAGAGWWFLNSRATIPEWDRLPALDLAAPAGDAFRR